MDLLLTSAGLTNQTISNTLAELAGRPLSKLRLAFIPTAANMEDGDKGWLINDLNACRKLFQSIDIVDISALPKEIWLPRLQSTDVIVVGGGHTGHLMRVIHASGFVDEIQNLLQKRVYVGISAGSMVAGPQLDPNKVAQWYSEPVLPDTPTKGLNIAPFTVLPHLNSPCFLKIREDDLRQSYDANIETYILDDQSAVVVKGKRTSVVSEGEWFKLPG